MHNFTDSLSLTDNWLLIRKAKLDKKKNEAKKKEDKYSSREKMSGIVIRKSEELKNKIIFKGNKI